MEHDHFITVAELLQLPGIFAAPFVLAGTVVQYRLLRRALPTRQAGFIAVTGALATVARTAALHYAAGTRLTDSLGFPAWVIVPLLIAAALVTAVV